VLIFAQSLVASCKSHLETPTAAQPLFQPHAGRDCAVPRHGRRAAARRAGQVHEHGVRAWGWQSVVHEHPGWDCPACLEASSATRGEGEWRGLAVAAYCPAHWCVAASYCCTSPACCPAPLPCFSCEYDVTELGVLSPKSVEVRDTHAHGCMGGHPASLVLSPAVSLVCSTAALPPSQPIISKDRCSRLVDVLTCRVLCGP